MSHTAHDTAPESGAGAPTDAARRSGGGLRRAIPGWMLVLFVVGDVLGAGIYTLVGQVAGQVGGAVWAPLLVAFVLALLTAASYAEMVTRFPEAGGAAVYTERAFRTPVVSFLVGISMLAAGIVSAAALSLAFAGDYLGAIVDLPAAPVAVAFLVLVALVNARGIEESVGVNVVMTVIEILGLLLVVTLGAIALGRGSADLGPVARVTNEAGSSLGLLGAVAGGAVLAFYSFVGFEVSANVAEEATDPRRDYPRALFIGLGAAAVLYVLVGGAVAATIPVATLVETTAPLLEVVRASDVPVPEWLFSVIALVAVGNGALLAMIMSSRLAFGMSRERLLPHVLTRLLPGRRTPWVAIVATTVLSAVLAATGTVATLAATTVLLLLVVFVAVNASVLKLRWEERRAPRTQRAGPGQHFRTWWPLPVLAIATCIWLATQQPAGVYLRAAILLAAGGLVWLVTHLTSRRDGARPVT